MVRVKTEKHICYFWEFEIKRVVQSIYRLAAFLVVETSFNRDLCMNLAVYKYCAKRFSDI